MLRFMTPYLLAALAIVVAGGVAYGSDAIGVLGAYGAVLAATLIAGAGYARWDSLQHHQR